MNDDPISGAFEPFGKGYDVHVPVQRDKVAELEERVRVLEAFVKVYDAWTQSPDWADGTDRFHAMVEARERVGKVSP